MSNGLKMQFILNSTVFFVMAEIVNVSVILIWGYGLNGWG
jgi:hypothetical protein